MVVATTTKKDSAPSKAPAPAPAPLTGPTVAESGDKALIKQVNSVDIGMGAPGARGGGTADVREVRAVARPTKEYVSTGSWAWILTAVQVLSRYIDDITRDFGPDQYERMMHDPQVASAVRIKVMAALSEPLMFAPAVEADDNNPQFPMAKEIADFVRWCFDHLKRPADQWLFEMGEGALVNGFKVAEQIYDVKEVIPGRGPQLPLVDLKCKPQESTGFVTDRLGNELGLVYIRPGGGISSATETTSIVLDTLQEDDPDYPQILPRQKFAVLSNRPRNGDPRGQSDLRTIYQPWWMKQQTWLEFMAYLARFGTPALIGYLAPGQENQLEEPGDEDSEEDPITEMVNTLMGLRGGGVAGMPNGANVDMLEASGEGQAFHNAFDYEDRQITQGLLYQVRATMEAENGSRADSETGQDVMGLVTMFFKAAIVSMVRLDVVTPLVAYNYGDEGLALLPKISLGKIEHQDFAEFAQGVAQLFPTGIIHWTMMTKLRSMLGLPPADEEVEATERKEKEAMTQQLQQAQLQGGAPPNGNGPGQLPGQGKDKPPNGGNNNDGKPQDRAKASAA